MSRTARRVAGVGPSPFAEMTALAARHGAVNLGQGFPDFPPPAWLQEALTRASAAGAHQYSPPPGLPALREIVAEAHAATLGFTPDADAEVTITVGATEGMAAALLALIEPGDEVIVIEPAYDSYAPQVRLAGGTPRFVPLQLNADGTWILSEEALRAALTPRTRALILNTPHNPTGKVFTRAELAGIARVAADANLIVLSDEVYDRLTYGRAHVSVASLPGMRERTVTIGSAGKTFAVTGWRVGWVIAPPDVTAALRAAHTFVPFCAPTPLQAAVAEGLRVARDVGYDEELRSTYREKRDMLADALARAGFRVLPCEGTFFLLADWSGLQAASGARDDTAFCRWLTTEVGVAAIPPSIFLTPEHRAPSATLARFVFCKTHGGLHEAASRLERWRRRVGP